MRTTLLLLMGIVCLGAVRSYFSGRGSPPTAAEDVLENKILHEPRTELQPPDPPSATPVGGTTQGTPVDHSADLGPAPQHAGTPAPSGPADGVATATEHFVEKYARIDVDRLLKDSPPLTDLNQNDAGALATLTAVRIKIPTGAVRVYSFFSGNSMQTANGCAVIVGPTVSAGYLSDNSLRIFRLTEDDGYGVLIRKSQLLIYYANVATWGSRNPNEEPRVILYYRADRAGRWSYQGHANENSDRLELSDDGAPPMSEQFCNRVRPQR